MSAASAVVQTFSAQLYSSRTATLTAFVLVVLLSGGVDRLTRARVERQSESLEFEG